MGGLDGGHKMAGYENSPGFWFSGDPPVSAAQGVQARFATAAPGVREAISTCGVAGWRLDTAVSLLGKALG